MLRTRDERLNRPARRPILLMLVLSWLVIALGASTRAEVAFVSQHGFDQIAVIDLETYGLIDTMHVGQPDNGGVLGLAASPDRSRVYVVNSDWVTNAWQQQVTMIDVASRSEIGSILLGVTDPGSNYNLPVDLAVGSDGSFAYITDFGRSSQRIYAVDLRSVPTPTVDFVPAHGRPTTLAITPDGISVYVTNHNTGDVSRIETSGPSKVGDIFASDSTLRGIAINSAGSRAYIGSQNRLSALDLASGVIVGTSTPFNQNLAFAGVGVSPDGSRVYACTHNSGAPLIVYDTTLPGVELTELTRLPVPCGGWTAPTFTADGTRFLVSSAGTVVAIEAASNQIVASIAVPGASFIAILPTVYECIGFEPPMAGGPVTVRGNRSLPFKAQLFDVDGYPITDTDLSAAPVIQVWYEYGTPDANDVSDEALPARRSTEGNQFFFDGHMRWHYNLKKKDYSGPGTYTVFMDSGDASQYLVDPTCTGRFVIK